MKVRPLVKLENMLNNVKLTFFLLPIMVVLVLLTGCEIPPPSPPVPEDDTERIPAEISLNLKSGKHEIKKSEYKLFGERLSGLLVSMKGFETTTSPGDPILPVRIYDVAVPPNIDWKSLKLTVRAGRTVTVPGQFDLLSAPPMQARVGDEELVDWGPDKEIVAGRNMKVYGQSRFFPAKPVRIVSHSQTRKWRFVRLEFSPVQYNPVKKSLRIVQSVQVRMNFMRIGKYKFRNDPLLADTVMDEQVEKRFTNYKEALQWYRYVPAPRPGEAVDDPDYVIITTNDIQTNSTELANFVAHKTSLGHAVQIVTESDYGSLVGPNGTAEKIRQWLINNYVPLGIHYVLLIGDPDPDDPLDPADTVGDLPMKMMWPHRSSYSNRESPTDYFYADLTGNWDLDGDTLFGEGVDIGNPISPDPAVGPDTFSVRWTGRIKIDADGLYNFATVSDDGIRVSIDGNPVIDEWASHELTTHSGVANLTAGEPDIEVEYYEDSAEGAAQLLWRPPGRNYYSHVPQTHLYHLVAGAYVDGGLDAEYFNNMDFTAPALTRLDTSINFFWGTGDKGLGGPDFDPEVFVGRIPVYNNDYAELDTILQKVIDYETGLPPAWRHNFLTPHVDMKPNQSNWKLGEALKADFADLLGFTTYRIYEEDFGLVPPPECPAINPKDSDPAAPCNMLGEWANGGGYGLVAWTTHGGETGASHLIASADATDLDDTIPAFTFQASCNNGCPENANNLGYALLREGAIGTVSASRVSWYAIFNPAWDPNPLSGTNENLTYYYSPRIMKDHSAGHALYLTKANIHPDGSWMNKMDYNLYGDPSSALFRTIGGVVLLFDTSGSMSWSHEGVPGVPLTQQRLSFAKEAAYPFMVLLNDHANTRMNFGISVFPPHPWSPAVGCNGQVVTPMTQVNDASANTANTVTIPNLVAQGNTPLLAGLDSALGMFATETPRIVVLLSDGYHNCPSFVNSTDPTVTNIINQLKAASISVYTIGFGRPTDIDPPLLTRLAGDTGGQFYDVTTASFDPTTWSPATDLQGTYKAILVDTLGLETATDPLGVIKTGEQVMRKIRINKLDRRISFFLSWETPQTNRIGLHVRSSDGIEVPITPITDGVSFHQGKTYKVLTVDRAFLRSLGKVGPSPWTLEILPSGLDQSEHEHYQYSVIMDSDLKMATDLDRQTYRVGDTIVLSAKITARKRPVIGLKDVYVDITSPREGLGNWLALNKVSVEELKKIPAQYRGERLPQLSRKGLYLANIRKVAFPGRTAPMKLHLYDDGTHGDAVANDGIYTNRIADTPKEGTYSLHIRASGRTDWGIFERDKVIQKHLKPRVSSRYVLVKVTAVATTVPRLRRFKIIVTPKDALGNHLGAGYANKLLFSAVKGKILGGIHDNLDGSYSQLIELPATVDINKVNISCRVERESFSFILADKLK